MIRALFTSSLVAVSCGTIRAMSSNVASSNVVIKRAAIAQMTSTNNKLLNLHNIAKCASLAKNQGATMLFLPECFGYMGSSSVETLENAEDLSDDNGVFVNAPSVTQWLQATAAATSEQEGPKKTSIDDMPDEKSHSVVSIMAGLRTIAQSTGLWISGGGIHERTSEADRIYNTHIILNPEGQIVGKYRKIHLFDVSIPNKVELMESKTTKAGDLGLQCCDTPLGRIGLTTCYDLRFPEQYLALAQTMGAQILLVPSAFTVPTGSAHWHILLQARAIETQCFVLAAAQVGRHNSKRESYGHALAVDPWGTIVADAGGSDSPTIAVCDIDHGQLEDIRLRMPVQKHRQAAQKLRGDEKCEASR